jgi:hypothetical protein
VGFIFYTAGVVTQDHRIGSSALSVFVYFLFDRFFRSASAAPHQGDQIGRIFAYWAIVFFWADF